MKHDRIKPANSARPASPDRRVELAQYGILDTPPETSFDEIASLAATICRTPMAAISFITERRHWLKAEIGFGFREIGNRNFFCRHVVAGNAPMILCDALADPQFADIADDGDCPPVRFYAGFPVRAADGQPIGALCVADPEPRPAGLADVQLNALKILAGQVQTQLELARSLEERDRRFSQQLALVKELNHIAGHDSLTELPNRTSLGEKIAQEIERAILPQCPVGLIVLDIDEFKQMNDRWGHGCGDHVLRTVAARLKETVSGAGTVARIGGDEFAVLIPLARSMGEIERLADHLLARIAEEIPFGPNRLHCRASLGYSIFPELAASPDELLKQANLALTEAQEHSPGRARVFEPAIADYFSRKSEMLELAQLALDERRVRAFYQPKVDLCTGHVVGAEALLRLQGANGMVALPGAIAAAFNDPALAVALSERMLDLVISDIKGWRKSGIFPGQVSINTTNADFGRTVFADNFLRKLDANDIEPESIEIEVTETVLLNENNWNVRYALSRLSKAGVGISLDDFGTGYASLINLKDLPISALKIDQSFVRGAHTITDDAIVAAVVSIAEKMNLVTIAEGVENQAEVERLMRLGVMQGQGFLFSKALSAMDFVGYLRGT